MTDVLLDGGRLCVLALFTTLAGRSFRRWRRENQGEAARWLTASFAVLAAVTLASVVFPHNLQRSQGTWEWKLTLAVLVLFPYCVYRFTAAFRPASPRLHALCAGLTASIVLWTLLMPDRGGAAERSGSAKVYVVVVLAEWTALSMLAAGWLWRAGRGQPSMARNRMRLLSLGSVMVNLVIVTLGSASPARPWSVQLTAQFLGMAGGWLFFAGFAPPAALRALWRQRELESFHLAQAQLIVALDPKAVADVIVPQAVALLGGQSALMTGADGGVLGADRLRAGEAEATAAWLGESLSRDGARVREPKPGLLALPVRGGWLAVEAGVATPFFGREEVALLEALGHSAELALARIELFERDRSNREALQERGAQLAQAQRLARIGSWEWHLNTGRVVWSDEMYRLYDLEPGDVEGDADYSWFRSRSHPEDTLGMEEAVREAVSTGQPFLFDHRIVGARGQIKWFRSRGQVVLDDTGGVVGLQGSAQEITAEKESETQLKARADQQAAVAQLGQRALGGLDVATLLQEAVGVVAEVLRADRCEVLELTASADSLLLRAATPALLGDGARSGAAVVIPGQNGPFGLLRVGAAPPGAFGTTDVDFLTSVANVLAAATQRHRIDDELVYQALHDPLTGLPNRVLLMDRLAQVGTRAGRQPTRLAVLFLDLDRFKVVNDGLGHWAGDQLLQAVADRLVAVVRPGDTVARFGGDEFVVLCEDFPGVAQVGLLAERIATALAEPVTLSGREVTITASIGVVLADAGSDTPEALIRDADTAMYQAKERGRARYELFDDPARKRVMDRLDSEVALHRALERDELRVFYQPVVSLSGGRIVGLEALLRWDHPERGLQLPDQFLALAEETGPSP